MATVPQQAVQGENIVHYGGVRLRVNGSGNLRLTFYSLDDESSQALVPIAMQATTGREPLRLANFISQRGMLEFQTTAINETFRVNRVVVFQKEIWTSYPG